MNTTAVRRNDRDRGRPTKYRDRGADVVLGAVSGLQVTMQSRSSIVLGSAPLAGDVTVDLGIDTLVVVNGAISTLNVVPTLWVLNARTKPEFGWNRHRIILNRAMEAQAKGRHVSHLVLLPVGQSEHDDDATLSRLAKHGATWENVVSVSRAVRERIVRDVCGFDRHETKFGTSAGIFAACLALWLKASSVELHGFSFEAGYAYLPIEDVPVNSRGHVRGDKRAIEAMRTKGYVIGGDTIDRRRQERVG